jgi:heme oxygenase
VTALRDATRGDHARTERSPFVTALLGGVLDRAAYADLLAQWHAVYSALESAGDAFAADPVAGPFVDQDLRRVPALAADLAYLAGPSWPAEHPLTAATGRYVARIAASREPLAFLAHHYTRYLGDLSGGQVIGRAVRSAYALDGGGATFFTFAAIPDAKAYKDAYRARLDALPPGALTAEVSVAYGHNAAVFAALAERHLAP